MSDEAPIPRAPSGLTTGARRVWRAILTERPGLSGAELAQLGEAVRMVSVADRLEDSTSGKVLAAGSQGQVVVHPALAEARHHRAAATQILERLKDPIHVGETRSQAAQRAARSRWDRRRVKPQAGSGASSGSDNVLTITDRMRR